MKPELRLLLHQATHVVAALPLVATAPLYRQWHLRWSARDEEVASPMPGDDLVPISHFTATRAITIDARPNRCGPGSSRSASIARASTLTTC